MLHTTCLELIFLVSVEKKKGFSSATCFSKPLKLIVRASRRGGVPVFNLPNIKLNFCNCSDKPEVGASPNLPAGVICDPI